MILQNIWRNIVGNILNNISQSSIFPNYAFAWEI